MYTRRRSLIIWLIGLGLTLIGAGITPLLMARAQDVETTPDPAAVTEDSAVSAIQPTGDNGYCALCHSQPWRTVTLRNGEMLNLYVSADLIDASVHGERSEAGALGCLDCHGQDAFPHSGPTPVDTRTYAIDSVAMCTECHTEQVTELESGLHNEAIMAGNLAAAVCTDCHGAHDVQPVSQFPQLVAGVCGDCHTTTLTEWRASAHVDIGPLGCGSCHSPHSQRIRIEGETDELCMNCHKDMPVLFVHATHVGTENEVGCVDCHMYTEPHVEQTAANGTPMSTGHSMVLDATPCNACHEQLVASGDWERLIADRQAEAAVATPEVVEQAAEAEAASTVETSYVQLFQGLILGLGFGMTAAAVFIARGSRQADARQNRARSTEGDEE